jgi:hypothetical protein
LRALLALAALVLLSGCATKPIERMAVLVTSNGDDPEIPESLAVEVRRRLPASPYLRPGGFADSLRSGIDSGVEQSGGKAVELDVEYVLAGTMSGRLVGHGPNHLGRRKVRCAASNLERCADRIIAGAVARLPEARKRIARAPASKDDFEDSESSITLVN